VFLFIENELSEKEKTGAVKVMNNSTFRQTGQNKVWQAGNVFLKALLLNDEKLAQRARDTIASEIYQTTNEGIQPDFSFHQHGAQQQFGNYGLAFISSMSYYANVFGGTKLAFSDSQINLLRNYVLDGENWVVWKGNFDVSACNRQLFKQAQVGKNLTFCVAVNQLKTADPSFETKYDDILNRNLQPGKTPEKPMTKHFWRSDLSIFRSATDYISVRSCSPRVKGTEFTNNENKKGHYISDGSTIIMRQGNEYKDIFPIWDWNRIPGVTAPLIDPVTAHTTTDDYKNPNPFVGGLTNENDGISTFHLARNGVFAMKSWFYMKGILICLGTNINSKIDKEIITNVNQCLQKSDATVLFSDRKTINCNDTVLSSTGFRAVLHDSIGYYFPTSQSITISLKKQSGNWHEIADPYSAEKVSGNVFNLWINHGINSTAVPTYEYVVLPSITQSGLKAFVKNPTFQILANNKNIQAVKSTTNDLFQFVFHKQGKIQTFSPTDFVDAKTLGLIQLRVNTDKSITLTVAEPTQSKKVFRLSINGKFTADFAKYDPLTGLTEIRIPLPKGAEAGKCQTIHLIKSME
jgi:chondroitin AC lyase